MDIEHCDGSMRDYNIPYTMNCTNITIIAENILGILKHLVNTTSPGELISTFLKLSSYTFTLVECINPVQICSSSGK